MAFLMAFFNFSHKRPRLLSWAKSSTHSAFGERSHTRAYTPKQGRFGWGAITTLGAFRTFTNFPGPGIRMAYFAAFGPWPGVLLKNTESLRNSDALMRVAVPRRRGPAGLRDFFVSVEIVACMPCTQSFLRVRGGGITTLDVLCVLLKRRTAACQKGSFAVSSALHIIL